MREEGTAGASWIVYRLSLLPSAEAETAMLAPFSLVRCSLRDMSRMLACSQEGARRAWCVHMQVHGALRVVQVGVTLGVHSDHVEREGTSTGSMGSYVCSRLCNR